jgi:hypothetical protein
VHGSQYAWSQVLARQFFEKCRVSKDPAILNRLRSISDSVWKAQDGKIIHNWDYEVEIHGGNTQPVHRDLQEAGFGPCAVNRCQYTTVLQSRELLVGVSFGTIARDRVWEKGPIYVHSVIADMTDDDDRSRLSKAVDEILTQLTREEAWSIFFPKLSVSISKAQESPQWYLAGGEVQRIGSSLLQTYLLPPKVTELLGEEVTLHISYESVVPRSLTSFRMNFPWLTNRCSARVTIHGALDFLTVNHWLFGGQDVNDRSETLQYKGEVSIQATDLVLPRSSVELRWQRKNVI